MYRNMMREKEKGDRTKERTKVIYKVGGGERGIDEM